MSSLGEWMYDRLNSSRAFWQGHGFYYHVPDPVIRAAFDLLVRWPRESRPGVYPNVPHFPMEGWRPKNTRESSLAVGLKFFGHGRNSNRHLEIVLPVTDTQALQVKRYRTTGRACMRIILESSEEVRWTTVGQYDPLPDLAWLNDTQGEFDAEDARRHILGEVL